eukprot:2870900-Prymnesium_polylepis.1
MRHSPTAAATEHRPRWRGRWPRHQMQGAAAAGWPHTRDLTSGTPRLGPHRMRTPHVPPPKKSRQTPTAKPEVEVTTATPGRLTTAHSAVLAGAHSSDLATACGMSSASEHSRGPRRAPEVAAPATRARTARERAATRSLLASFRPAVPLPCARRDAARSGTSSVGRSRLVHGRAAGCQGPAILPAVARRSCRTDREATPSSPERRAGCAR